MREQGDRRKSARWQPSGVVAKLVCEGFRDSGDTEDISPIGFRLKANWDYPVGSYLTVRLVFPTGEEMEIEARIAWRKRAAEGAAQEIGFFVTTHKNFDRFQEVVERCSKEQIEDRRTTQRRRTSDNSPVERRARDRRGTITIRRRTDLDTSAMDPWISTYTYERVIQSSSSSSVVTHDQSKIMLGSNNYLGLTDHPKVKEAAIKAIEKYGTGAGGARVLSGTMELHKRLEERLAEFEKAEACLIFPAGYLANFAVLGAILKKGDVVLNDEVNHASIIDGCRFSEAVTRFYRHGDMENLERKLAQYESDKPRLIITDGVFSMDGDVAPLDKIVALGKKYGAMVMVDDAHSTGVIGERGHGTAEHCGVLGQVDITIATLSKSLGAAGGAVCASRSVIKSMFHRARQFIFTSALPPATCAGALAALDVIDAEPQLVRRLHENRRFLWSGLKEMGYNAIETPSAVIPVIIGDEEKTYALTRRLDELGVFVNAVSSPAVPRELSRLRVSVMATHTQEQLGEALDAFKKGGRSLDLI